MASIETLPPLFRLLHDLLRSSKEPTLVQAGTVRIPEVREPREDLFEWGIYHLAPIASLPDQGSRSFHGSPVLPLSFSYVSPPVGTCPALFGAGGPRR